MGAVVEDALIHQVLVEDSIARVWRVSEYSDVPAVSGEGDVGKRVGRERIWDYVEHVHGRSSEVDRDRSGTVRGLVSSVEPGLVVNLCEI